MTKQEFNELYESPDPIEITCKYTKCQFNTKETCFKRVDLFSIDKDGRCNEVSPSR